MINNRLKILKILFIILMMILLISNFLYAIDYDKKGNVIETIKRPQKKDDVVDDSVSVARSFNSPSKNIISDGIINETEFTDDNKDITVIRHTPGISNIDDNSYEIIHDSKSDRIKLLIRENGVGEWYAKNGFYRVNGKTYYFDKDGLMVLGDAVDNMGKKYFFSYETGELTDKSIVNNDGLDIIEINTNKIKHKWLYSGFVELTDDDIEKYGIKTILMIEANDDMTSKEFRTSLKNEFEFLSKYEGPYYIYSDQKTKKLGFLLTVLEALNGADYSELIDSYKKIYDCSERDLVEMMRDAGFAEDIRKCELKSSAEQYLYSLGLNEEIVAKLKNNLT